VVCIYKGFDRFKPFKKRFDPKMDVELKINN